MMISKKNIIFIVIFGIVLYSLRSKKVENFFFPKPLGNNFVASRAKEVSTTSSPTSASATKIVSSPTESATKIVSSPTSASATKIVSSPTSASATESKSSLVNERATESVSSNNVSKKTILAALGLGEKQLENLKKLSKSFIPIKNNSFAVFSNLDLRGKLTTNTLEVKNTSDFGTSSNRKISIVPSSYRKDGTYFAFFNGKKRTNYMIPRINGQLYNNGHLTCEGNLKVNGKSHLMGNVGVRSKPYNHIGLYVKGADLIRGIETNGRAGIGAKDFLIKGDTIPGYARKSALKGYLKEGSKFKLSAITGGYGGVVWSNSITGNNRERGLAARRIARASGDPFMISQVL